MFWYSILYTPDPMWIYFVTSRPAAQAWLMRSPNAVGFLAGDSLFHLLLHPTMAVRRFQVGATSACMQMHWKKGHATRSGDTLSISLRVLAIFLRLCGYSLRLKFASSPPTPLQHGVQSCNIPTHVLRNFQYFDVGPNIIGGAISR